MRELFEDAEVTTALEVVRDLSERFRWGTEESIALLDPSTENSDGWKYFGLQLDGDPSSCSDANGAAKLRRKLGGLMKAALQL